jgi:AcrR family transcriptional regulator
MELIERIFYGGIEEFKEHGFKFTMDSLAKRVGISKRTLYETVSSKEALLELVIDKTFEDVKRQQKDILNNKELVTLEKLKKLLSIVPIYSNNLDYRRVEELATTYPRLHKKVQDGLENDWDGTIMLIERAMDEGVIRKVNVEVLRFLLVDIFEKLIDGERLIQNNISYEVAMEEIMFIVFNGILVETEGEEGNASNMKGGVL